MIKNTLILILLILSIYIAGVGMSQDNKETPDWTGTTQGQDSIKDLHIHKCIHISEKARREMDSIDDYMRHWYEVLDTNSDGDIDE